MEFKPENVPAFLEIFHQSAPFIRASEGCTRLELYQDQHHPQIIFTYSYWEDESFLEKYRHSELFTDTWARTKVLFGGKPQAWSVDRLWEG